MYTFGLVSSAHSICYKNGVVIHSFKYAIHPIKGETQNLRVGMMQKASISCKNVWNRGSLSENLNRKRMKNQSWKWKIMWWVKERKRGRSYVCHNWNGWFPSESFSKLGCFLPVIRSYLSSIPAVCSQTNPLFKLKLEIKKNILA